jgi:hypothetical protein
MRRRSQRSIHTTERFDIAFDRLFQAAVEAGHGQDDFASLIQVMRHRVPSLSSGQGMTQEK